MGVSRQGVLQGAKACTQFEHVSTHTARPPSPPPAAHLQALHLGVVDAAQPRLGGRLVARRRVALPFLLLQLEGQGGVLRGGNRAERKERGSISVRGGGAGRATRKSATRSQATAAQHDPTRLLPQVHHLASQLLLLPPQVARVAHRRQRLHLRRCNAPAAGGRGEEGWALRSGRSVLARVLVRTLHAHQAPSPGPHSHLLSETRNVRLQASHPLLARCRLPL